MKTQSGNSTIEVDENVGAISKISLQKPAIEFIREGWGSGGLFEMALPLKDCVSHRIRVDQSQAPAISCAGKETVIIKYEKLGSSEGTFPLKVEIRINGGATGEFSLRMKVSNQTPTTIPQVIFPNLSGLIPVNKPEKTVLVFGRGKLKPFTDLTSPDETVVFYNLHQQRYYDYPGWLFCMKWFDLGEDIAGLTLFSKDLTSDAQGLFVEKTEEKRDILRIGWAHYPHLAPGQTWESPEFIIYPHQGTWQRGADLYRQFTDKHLKPAPTTKYLKDAPGLRSVFMTNYPYSAAKQDPGKANFLFGDLPLIAKDALKYGIKEIVIWFFQKTLFELPSGLDPRFGSEKDLREALEKCRRMGVNVAAFVSSRGIRPESAPEEWFEHDSQGKKHSQFFTYSHDFVPRFNPLYYDLWESAFICPASKGWQKAFLEDCRELNRLGFSSICFDQILAWHLCYNKSHTHKPQETARYLHQTLQKANEEGKKIDPAATFSGELVSDIQQQFQHYSWEWQYDWISGYGIVVKPADFAAFRYVFPRFRVTWLVDRSLRWLHQAFTYGLWINFFPRGGAGYIGEDKEFSREVKRLAGLRKEFSRFFESGDYLGQEVLMGNFDTACAFRYQSEGLIIAANPEKKKRAVEIEFPLEELPSSGKRIEVKVFREKSPVNVTVEQKNASFFFKETLEAHELILIHIRNL